MIISGSIVILLSVCYGTARSENSEISLGENTAKESIASGLQSDAFGSESHYSSYQSQRHGSSESAEYAVAVSSKNVQSPASLAEQTVETLDGSTTDSPSGVKNDKKKHRRKGSHHKKEHQLRTEDDAVSPSSSTLGPEQLLENQLNAANQPENFLKAEMNQEVVKVINDEQSTRNYLESTDSPTPSSTVTVSTTVSTPNSNAVIEPSLYELIIASTTKSEGIRVLNDDQSTRNYVVGSTETESPTSPSTITTSTTASTQNIEISTFRNEKNVASTKPEDIKVQNDEQSARNFKKESTETPTATSTITIPTTDPTPNIGVGSVYEITVTIPLTAPQDQEIDTNKTNNYPHCPTMQDFISSSKSTWNKLQTGSGIMDGVKTIAGSVANSVKSVGSCIQAIYTKAKTFFSPKTKSGPTNFTETLMEQSDNNGSAPDLSNNNDLVFQSISIASLNAPPPEEPPSMYKKQNIHDGEKDHN